MIADNTPVIVGLGFHQVKSDDPTQCPEAIEMMKIAVEDAAKDCGNKAVVKDFESISVLRGSWKYSNPGLMLSEHFGCPSAKTIMSEIGVLQMMPCFQLCDAISKGEQEVGLVVGGEARFRDLRSMISGVAVSETTQGEDTPEPDQFYRTPDLFWSELDDKLQVWAPGEFYAIADSAVRYHEGLSIEQYRKELGDMYANFSEVAANNPHAWRQEKLSSEEFSEPQAKSKMISFPFTKNMMSQWNINQSVAIIICSYKKAKTLGLDESKFIYPMSYAQSRHVTQLCQKKTLHTHPGTVLTGEKAIDSAGITTNDITVADLYSCFPSSIRAGKKDIGLGDEIPLSVTGTMALAGGPYNHAAIDAVARMAEVLRNNKSDNHDIGFVTNISGMFGKQAAGLLSTQPCEKGFQFDDITDEVKEKEVAVEIDENYQGTATVVAYTVMYVKGELSHAVAYCDTPEGKRTIVKTFNKELAERMTEEEFVNQKVNVLEGHDFEALN